MILSKLISLEILSIFKISIYSTHTSYKSAFMNRRKTALRFKYVLMEIEPMKSHMPKGKHSINILKERLYIECKHLC